MQGTFIQNTPKISEKSKKSNFSSLNIFSQKVWYRYQQISYFTQIDTAKQKIRFVF